jgi:thermitase
MNKRRHKGLWIILLVISIVLTTAVYGAPLSTAEETLLAGASYVPGRIVVKFKEGSSLASLAQVHARYNAVVKEEIPQIGVQVLSVPPGEVEAKIAAFRADPRVELAEPDYIAQVAYEPNDPYYGDGTQWGPQKVFASQAWDLSTGDPNVIVAIVDSGADPNHPDLAGKLVTGYNFMNSSTNTTDDHGHGTHVAGIVAAATDNGVGIAGVAFNSQIMPLKVYDKSTDAWYSRIANAIIYAADNGAKVINLSLGNYPSSGYLQYAVNYAWDAGCVLVGAAGNNNCSDPFYPAAYDNVIGVAATDQSDVKASWSNWGAHISVAAPGVSIYSTYWNSGSTYAHMSGTSMAAPHVAGLAALLFSQDGGRSNATVRSLIEGSADDLGDAGWDQYYGYGRINAYRALGTVSAVIAPTGGSLSADNGDLTLDFPDGSVPSSTTVTYMPNPSPSNPTGDLIFADMDCVLEATDGQGDPVTQFDPPYTLTLLYQDSDWQDAGVEDESTLNLYYWDGSQWEAILPCEGCSLNTVDNELVAVLGHFSEFGLMGGEGDPTRVSLSSFVARSGGAAPAPDKIAPLGELVLIGLTLIAFGAKSPARARLWKRLQTRASATLSWLMSPCSATVREVMPHDKV